MNVISQNFVNWTLLVVCTILMGHSQTRFWKFQVLESATYFWFCVKIILPKDYFSTWWQNYLPCPIVHLVNKPHNGLYQKPIHNFWANHKINLQLTPWCWLRRDGFPKFDDIFSWPNSNPPPLFERGRTSVQNETYILYF